jgi:hypothetical protein
MGARLGLGFAVAIAATVCSKFSKRSRICCSSAVTRDQ